MARKTPEETYQFIKLVKSGRSLAEIKALAKSATVAMRDNYANQKDVNVINSIEGGLHNLLMTRGDAVKIMKARFTPRRNIIATREEHAAKFMTRLNTGLSADWALDGNLSRRGAPNAPRPGSSQGKVGRTRFKGHTKTLGNLKKMLAALQRMVAQGDNIPKGTIKKIYKSVARDVKVYGGKR